MNTDYKPEFSIGDLVTHPGCPEWGTGKVKGIETIIHQGRSAQRLKVDFAQVGLKVINTGVAPIVKKSAKEAAAPPPAMKIAPSLAAAPTPTKVVAEALPTRGWLDAMEAEKGGGRNLWDLPVELTDVMVSTETRLERTCEAYRFTPEPGPLYQWAVAQTGLDDPLSRYTRVEIEKAFFQYSRLRDDHLFDLARQLRRDNRMGFVHALAERVRHRKARELLEKTLRW